ncbi:MAG: hypothetical protein WCD18_00560 [Thermosynechococcaceae cyanobacterium]
MNQNATAALIELREHYQSLFAQSDPSSAHAKVQLAHVEALLLEALLPTPELPTHNVTLIADQPAQPKAMAPHQESAPAAIATPSQPPRKSSKPGKAIAPSDPVPVASAEPMQPEAVQSDANIAVKFKPATKSQGKAPKSKAAIAQAPPTQPRSRDMVLALPAEYEGLRKIDAVALILESNPGNPIHTDTIIEKLYGHLPEDVHKAEKIRMSNVMARGIKNKLWKRAIAPGCYLVNLAEPQSVPAEAPAKASKPRASQSENAKKRSDKAPALRKSKKEG